MTACSVCDGPTIAHTLPEALQGHLEDDPDIVSMCEQCLRVAAAGCRSVDPTWDPAETSGVLPADPDAAIGLGVLVTLLESLAINRSGIEAVVGYLEEEHGVDPLLALDRIATAPLLKPNIDVRGRRDQLAQML